MCVCDKGFVWNLSNYKCKCDKSCHLGEYLDYENFKCRKKLFASLIKKCTETVEEAKLAKLTFLKNENSYKCIPCTLYVVLLSISFTINIAGIVTYYVFSQYYRKKRFTKCWL